MKIPRVPPDQMPKQNQSPVTASAPKKGRSPVDTQRSMQSFKPKETEFTFFDVPVVGWCCFWAVEVAKGLVEVVSGTEVD